MNLCSNHNILIWNVENYGDYYIMHINISGFFLLKPILRKTKTKVVIMQKYGLPFLLPKIKKRSIFFAGVFICLCFLIVMSNYIWSIEIIGNSSITDEEFMDYLKEEDITYGIKKRKIPIEQLEKDIRQRYDIIIWDSIQIKGTRLFIKVKENTNVVIENKAQESDKENADSHSETEPRDLIAGKKGEIVKMVTRKGVPQFKIGDMVEKNDILVSGLIPIIGEDAAVSHYQYCVSDADIYLKCNYTYQDEIDLNYTIKKFTENEKRIYSIEVLSHEYTIPHTKIKYETYDVYEEKKQMKVLDNFYFPIFGCIKSVREYQLKTGKYQVTEANRILSEHLNEFIATLEEKGVQIIGKDVKIVNINEKLQAIGIIRVIERTGTSVASTLPNQEEMENTHE